jgi:hypothetical protein
MYSWFGVGVVISLVMVMCDVSGEKGVRRQKKIQRSSQHRVIENFIPVEYVWLLSIKVTPLIEMIDSSIWVKYFSFHFHFTFPFFSCCYGFAAAIG